MRALSFSQPWLWAVLHAGKHVENRKWAPPIAMIGERIALHAAKSWDKDAMAFCRTIGVELPGCYDLKESDRRNRYHTSMIVGVATIDRVVTVDKTLPDDQKRWFFGPFGWILTDIRVLPKGIPATGKLGLWTMEADLEYDVRRALEVAGAA